jgi:hypothetical protein
MQRKKGKYRHVYYSNKNPNHEPFWYASIFGRSKSFPEEEELIAAIWVDIQLIKEGKSPVNILNNPRLCRTDFKIVFY